MAGPLRLRGAHPAPGVRGWGADARPGLAALLDEALAAVDGDPGRLRVVFRVTPRACAVLTWGDVYPLVEEAILTRATAVIVEDGGRAEPGLRLIGGGDRTRPSLDWLAAHQATDGRWAAAGFGDTCDANPMREPATGGAGHPGYDVGTTGLSLLAFLGAGYTNRGRHKFARTVWKGLRFLKSVQRGTAASSTRTPPGPRSSTPSPRSPCSRRTG